jgi:ATP-binding cassette subfamily B protein
MKFLIGSLRFFLPDWPRVGVALMLVAASSAAGLLRPWPLALVVDCVLNGGAWPPWLVGLSEVPKPAQLAALAGLTLALHIGHGGLQSLLNFTLIDTGLRGLSRVRRAMFDWLLKLSLRRLHGSQAGDILYRATWDTYAFQTLFQHGVFSFLTASTAVVAMAVVMARLNTSLTWIALATVPALLAVMSGFGRHMSRRAEAAQVQDSALSSAVQQCVANLQLTQSYTREPEEAKRFHDETVQALALRRRQHGLEVLYLATVALVFALGTAAILWFGSRQVLAGRLSIGQLLIFLAYLAQLYEPLNQLSHVGSTLSNARAGTRRVLELFTAPAELSSGSRSVPGIEVLGQPPKDPAVKASLAFEDVRFGYQADHDVLQGVSFRVQAGESVAIVGPSGAGKSTLLQLVPRFFDPTAGSILWGGINLREFGLREWRSQVGLVLQEPLLIRGTIRENLAYARPDASPDEIEAAARAARADTFIRRLPKGYDSVVGDGAVRLSVGEKQRLNLARALLKNAPVLLLDEPTSALDRESEAHVMGALRDHMRGRITLMVTHRPETLQFVDKVLVLAEGGVQEFAKPSEVLWQTTFLRATPAE